MKNYIKMCKQAKEIQEKWKPKRFDYYYAKLLGRDFVLAELNSVNIIEKYIFNYIWLPTQEQLFAMVNFDKLLTFEFSSHKKTRTLYIMRTDGTCSLYKDDNFKGCILQYIMYEKYKKIWTGEKWVKANE